MMGDTFQKSDVYIYKVWTWNIQHKTKMVLQDFKSYKTTCNGAPTEFISEPISDFSISSNGIVCVPSL